MLIENILKEKVNDIVVRWPYITHEMFFLKTIGFTDDVYVHVLCRRFVNKLFYIW